MLQLKLRESLDTQVAVHGTSPDRLAALSLESVRRQKVWWGNRETGLGELFEVTGDPADGQQSWAGDLRLVNGIGYRMTDGEIRIAGSAGDHTGARMTGGSIFAEADLGDAVGCEMAGGRIEVRGNVGNGTGAAWPGSNSGQTGGVILVTGSAGHRTGHAMRRGMIVVQGDTGNCCGWLMRAGTIQVGGRTGKNPGAEMVRGTLVLLHNQPVAAGFVSAGIQTMPVIRLLNNYLQQTGWSGALPSPRVHVFHGDRLQGARGELLMAID